MKYEYYVFYMEHTVRMFFSERQALAHMNEMADVGFDVEVYAKEIETGKLFLIAKRSGNHE